MKKLWLWLELLVQFLWVTFLVILVIRVDGKCLAAGYLNPRYFWLIYISIGFFTCFLLTTMVKIFSGQVYGGRAPVFLYMLIPLVLLPVANRAQLGTDTVARRGVVFTEVNEDAGTQIPVPELRVKNPDGTDRYSDLLMNPERSVGQDVELIGRAAFNSLLPEESFYIYRFIIFCCVADAMPSGFIVIGTDISSVEEEQWYRLKGTVGMTTVDGQEYLSVTAESLERVDEPDSIYEDYWASSTK